MKKLLFSILTLVCLGAAAQTVDEVIQKYAANIGGLDAFSKFKTSKMTGNFSMQGQDFPMTIQVINNKAIRSEVNVSGTSIISAYKDGKGWQQNPFAGATEPTSLEGDALDQLKTQSMIADPLIDYKARGHQVELQGEEDIEGTKAYKIKLTNKESGKATSFFINSANYNLVKTIADREMMGQTVAVETWFADIKEVKGVKVPTTMTMKIDGQEFSVIKFDSVEFDVEVDEKIFDKP